MEAADEPPRVSFRDGLKQSRPPSIYDAALASLDHKRVMFVRFLIQTGRMNEEEE